jgi:hypothetical protein
MVQIVILSSLIQIIIQHTSNRFLTQTILGTLGKLNKRRRQRYLYFIESLPFHTQLYLQKKQKKLH